jgi:hypothetical protein
MARRRRPEDHKCRFGSIASTRGWLPYFHMVPVSLLVGCGQSSGTSTPTTGAQSSGFVPAPCDRPAPPYDNESALADNCGVSAIIIDRPDALPVAQGFSSLTMELYIDQASACAINGLNGNGSFCGVGDNRSFAKIGSSDKADLSRNRVYASFDFSNGDASFRVNPSCSIPNGGGEETCNPPHPDGDGNNITVLHSSDISSELQMQFTEAAYPGLPFHACSINEDLTFTVNPNHTFTLASNGTSLPSIAIVYQGHVVVADQGIHITGLCAPPGQSYSYTSPSPTASSTTGTSTTGTST